MKIEQNDFQWSSMKKWVTFIKESTGVIPTDILVFVSVTGKKYP
jgi:hypothetical protein